MLKTSSHHQNATPASISVVIPAYNEGATIEEIYLRLRAVLAEVAAEHEIIFVDDGSQDNTLGVLRRLSENDANLRYFRFRRNFGKSAALAAGFREARYPLIVTMDADLQDIPEELPRLLDKLAEGYDLVSGWRRHRRDTVIKRISSKLYNWTTASLTGVRLHDINCGFKCYRREVLDEILVYGERHRYIPVLASYRGFRLGEVKIEHAERRHGKSRYGWGRVVGGVFSLLTIILLTRYTGKPLHFFGLLGAGLFSVGLVIDAYLVIERVLQKSWLSNRPLLIIGTLLITVGIQFILFGLLAEMIAHTSHRDTDYAIVETGDERQARLPAAAAVPAVPCDAARQEFSQEAGKGTAER